MTDNHKNQSDPGQEIEDGRMLEETKAQKAKEESADERVAGEPVALADREPRAGQEAARPPSTLGGDAAAELPGAGSVLAEGEKALEDSSFAQMYERSLERIQEGSIVKGKVVQITQDHVVVDVGAKSEGQVPLAEFFDAKGNLEVQIGDEVDVLLEASEDEEGGIRLSRSKAARIKVWESISEAYRNSSTIKGKVIARVKGGLSVDVGVQAFLPGSQIDLRPVRDVEAYIGQTFDFKVLKYSKKRANVVLSRRAVLEEERSFKKAALVASLAENAVLEGVVKNITDYGVFVDLGGMDGLLHITDISWGRVGHPSERFSIGDKLKVKVLSFDRERERVSLGLKQLVPDPWTTVAERHAVGSRVVGKVVSLTDYGAFVELEEGVEGLIHVSEMSWTSKIRHPSKVVQVGDRVEAVILNIDTARRRISLGMKQAMPDPWETIDTKYPVGTTIEGRIKNVTDFGVFIGIDDGIDGLVHISDLSWSKRVKHPSDLYKKGDVVKAMVLQIDKPGRRFSLGIKQAMPDPWENAAEKYPIGAVVEGVITNVTDFGVFVEIAEGVEGLIHVSEISKEKIKTPVGRFNVGDRIQAKVVHLSPKERRIGLSVKRLEEEADQPSVNDYLRPRQEATSNLGELIMNQLKSEKNS